MPDIMKEFLVSVGFKLNEDSQKKVDDKVKQTETRITETLEDQGTARVKLEDKSSAKRQEKADEEFKRDRARRNQSFKELTKHVEGYEALADRFNKTISLVQAGLVGSAFVQNIAGTAQSYSRLAMQAQRDQSSPRSIAAIVYSLGQMGVGRGEADSSIDGFAGALRKSPGLRSILQGKNIRTQNADGSDRSAAEIFPELGEYFKNLPQNVALARSSQLGISQDTMIALEKGDQFRKGLGEFGGIQNAFGVDPDQASKDGRDLVAAYDKTAADLKAVQDKIDTTFFKPMADGFKLVSAEMEKHPKKVEAITIAFEALAAVLAGSVFVKLARVSGALDALKAPLWLLRMLGISGGAAATAGLLASTNSTDEGEPTMLPSGVLLHSDGTLHPAPGSGARGGAAGHGRSRLGTRSADDDAAVAPTGADDPLKKFITGHESGGYNVVYGHNENGGPNAPPKPITDMTIAEVLAYQHEMRSKNGTRAWPVGRAQWVETTLRGLTKGMDPNTKFTPEVQEGLFDKSIAGRINQGPAGMRNEWDSLRHVDDATLRAAIESHRNYKPPAAVAKTDANGAPLLSSYMSPDGTISPTGLSGYNKARDEAELKRTRDAMDRANHPSPFGALMTVDPANASRPMGPLGVPASMLHLDSSRGDTHATLNQTVNVHGASDPQSAASAVVATTKRGHQDIIRNVEGSSQ